MFSNATNYKTLRELIRSGAGWTGLLEAVQSFLVRRLEEKADDVVTMIVFSNSAKIVCNRFAFRPMLVAPPRVATISWRRDKFFCCARAGLERSSNG